jgi:hypothetical protein
VGSMIRAQNPAPKMRPIVIAILVAACGAEPVGPPPCGSLERGLATLVPGPGRAGFDADLAAKALRHDRMFAAVHSHATGLNADFRLNDESARAALIDFAAGEAFELESVESLGVWEKSAGLYSGAGVAADAYRYGVLRDDGESCAEIDTARAQLIRAMEGLDLAARIDGVAGVMARSLVRNDLPHGEVAAPTPLFDENGSPLPPEKNNGTWRVDQTGEHPNYIWEDSLSRDMLVGWALAYGAIAEIVEGDDSLPPDLIDRLREDARDEAYALMKVGESGYDLEIPDADGRLTFHAYLNENSIDRLYVDGAENGFTAIMALGIVGALARLADDPTIDAYVADTLITERKLAQIAERDMLIVNTGAGSNFSNYNMAFTGMYLAERFVDHVKANVWIEKANAEELYRKEGAPEERSPAIMKQSFFDFVHAAGVADPDAVTAGLETLRGFPDAPYFEETVINCDESEIASGSCTLNDGTEVHLLGEVGWNGILVAKELVPMQVRPSSNYHWRSDPFRVNAEGSPLRLLPSVDFRIAYWIGRWSRLP